jgi:hypothetical protein
MTQALNSNVMTCNTPPLGVSEISKGADKLAIFPNPLINQVAQVTCGNKNGIVTIYDITSKREVGQVVMKDGKAEINGAGIVSGIYLLQLVSDKQEIAYGKLIVVQ